MSAFPKMLLTNVGIALQAKVQSGVTLELTRIGLGDGNLNGQPISPLKNLINQTVSVPIMDGKQIINSNTLQVPGFFSNKDVQVGFWWREFGVFANDPDSGEILYAYSNAGNAGDYIPTIADQRIEKLIYASFTVQNAENVNITIPQSDTFIPKKEKGAKDGVATLDETGKIPQDQLPELDFIPNSEKGQPNGVATLDEHGKVKELPELNFDPAGSAATVQGNLNAHINNKQNPHGVTAAQVGAYDKNQSLTSVTAGLFGLPASAVPNDVLNKIKTLMDASSGEISQRIRMITGAYIGDSVEYNTPNPRTISLGVYPLAVMVSLNGMDFGTFTNVSGGIAFRDNPVYAKPTVNANENLIEAITITSNGFVVDNYMANGCAAFTNRTNYGTYYYIAFY